MPANDASTELASRKLPRELGALLLAVALYLLQDVAISHIPPGSSLAWLRAATFFVATLCFIALALVLRRYLAAWVVAAGIAMNFLPMAAHGGLMPIAYEVIRDSGAFPQVTEEWIGRQVENSKDIVLWRDDVRFYFFSDRFFLEVPGYGPNIYSLGDFVAFSGVALGLLEGAAFVLLGSPPLELALARLRGHRHRRNGQASMA